MVQVLATRTPISPTEAIDALWHGHQDVIGGACPIPLLEILAAHSALETGRWHAMWNFNFGNLRGPGDFGETIAIPGAGEVVDGHEVIGPEIEANFASFRDRYRGARAFVAFLGTASHPPHPNRYQAAWDRAVVGDVVGYVTGLKLQGYFTAALGPYIDGVRGTLTWIQSGPMAEFLTYLSPAQKRPSEI